MTNLNAAHPSRLSEVRASNEPRARVRGPELNHPSFREVLRTRAADSSPQSGERVLRDAAASIERGERLLEQVIRSARSGRAFSNEELIAIQAGVYRYSQALELAGKLVEKLTGAVRQTLQSQQ
jgi:hypothetical protein